MVEKKAGRGNQGSYKGIWCDSSWELAWVIYNLEHNIPFERNFESFEYYFNKKKHRYFPDFKIAKNQYVEIKGVITDQLTAKIRYFPHTLIILYEKQMKMYLEYVREKYGKNYITLYDSGVDERFSHQTDILSS